MSMVCPDPDEYVTAHDLAMLAARLIRDFPEYFHYDAEKEFTYNGIKQGNRNPLLYKDLGVDGMKTGHTEEAGYGITVTALRGGRRIVEVLSGMKSMNMRSQESEKLLSWAYREWADYKLVKAGDTIDDAPSLARHHRDRAGDGAIGFSRQPAAQCALQHEGECDLRSPGAGARRARPESWHACRSPRTT